MRYRTIWISDVHLGTRQCDADALLSFLEHHNCDYLFANSGDWGENDTAVVEHYAGRLELIHRNAAVATRTATATA